MTIAEAQAELENSQPNFLPSIGQQREDVGVKLERYEAAIIKMAAKFGLEAQQNLIKADRNSSGNLEKSIKPVVKQWSNGVNIVDIFVDYYYKFVDAGVKGLKGGNSAKGYSFKYLGVSKKMLDKLEEWVNHEKISFRNSEEVRSIRDKKRNTITSASRKTAYLIGKSIKKKGLEQTKFWTDALDQLERDIATGVADALRIDVIENI